MSFTLRLLYLHGINLQYPCRGAVTFSYSVCTGRTAYRQNGVLPFRKMCFFLFSVYFTSEESVHLQNRLFTVKRAFLSSEQCFYCQNVMFTVRTQTLLHPPIHKHTFQPSVLLRGSWCPELCFWIATYLLTPRCRVLLEQLTGLQLVNKFPAFHGTRRFITALTSVRHLSLSWASPIQSIYPHPNSWRSFLILSTHLRLGLPSGLFPSGFSTKTPSKPLPSPSTK